VCCSVLQCVAVCCSVPLSVSFCIVFHATKDAHHTLSFCSVFLGLLSVFLHVLRVCVLQCVAVCCSVLQCVAACCSVLQCVAVRCSLFLGLLSVFLQVLRVCVLQCVAMCCSVLQCVAACCSVLQCVAVVFLGSLVSFCRCQRMLTTTSATLAYLSLSASLLRDQGILVVVSISCQHLFCETRAKKRC